MLLILYSVDCWVEPTIVFWTFEATVDILCLIRSFQKELTNFTTILSFELIELTKIVICQYSVTLVPSMKLQSIR